MVYLSEDIAIIWILLMTLIIMAYPLYMEIFNNGQTVGKSVMSIRVMCLDGSKPSKTASMLRWLLYLIDIFMGMGLFFVVFSKNCQRVGDLAAGTTVVKVKREKRPFVLSDYQFTKVGYLPSYPEVTKLNMRQVSVIENVLYTNNDQMREAYIEPFVTRIAVRLQQIPYLRLLQMAAKACCPVEQQQRVRLSLRYAEDFDSLAGKTRLVRGQQPFEIIKAVPAEGEQTRGPQPDEQRRGVEAHELFETLSSQNASPLVENYYHRCSACIISKMFLNYKAADKIFRFRLCPPMR